MSDTLNTLASFGSLTLGGFGFASSFGSGLGFGFFGVDATRQLQTGSFAEVGDLAVDRRLRHLGVGGRGLDDVGARLAAVQCVQAEVPDVTGAGTLTRESDFFVADQDDFFGRTVRQDWGLSFGHV
ncbi:hypothetical protein D3C81_700880 [compost metagenome]